MLIINFKPTGKKYGTYWTGKYYRSYWIDSNTSELCVHYGERKFGAYADAYRSGKCIVKEEIADGEVSRWEVRIISKKELDIPPLGIQTIQSAFNGNDSITGGKGNDTLDGGGGDDTYHFNKGDGGLGNDTYFFSKGDGKDFIHDTDDTSFFWWNKEDAGHDTIAFGKDITKDDISFIMNKGDLLIQYGESDTIKVKDQDSKRNQIEQIELSDGNYLTNDDIDLVIQQINAYGHDNGMHHINNKDIQNNADLMNIVSSAWNA